LRMAREGASAPSRLSFLRRGQIRISEDSEALPEAGCVRGLKAGAGRRMIPIKDT